MPHAFLYVSAGFGYDGFQFLQGVVFGMIPVVGWMIAGMLSFLIAVLAFKHFIVLNQLHSITLMDKIEKFLIIAGLRFFDLFPVIGALPLLGVSAILTVLFVWREDHQYNKKQMTEYQNQQQQLYYQYQQAYAYEREQSLVAQERQRARAYDAVETAIARTPNFDGVQRLPVNDNRPMKPSLVA